MNSSNQTVTAVGLLLVLATVQTVCAMAAIPVGTPVQVRITEHLTSQKTRPGEVFHGTLTAPISVNGRALYQKGANVTGQVAAVHSSGRLSDPGVLELVLTSVGTGKNATRVTSESFIIKGESHTKNNITKIGGGTAAGAILGGIFGGGKGAAIGAGIGAAGGTAAAATTGRKEAEVESEAVLNFRTAAPIRTSSPAEYAARDNQPRPEYDHAHYHDADYDRERDEVDTPTFSSSDRRVIQSCMADSYSNLPPGLAKKDHLPPGLEKQLQRNGTLPPGLQKRVQPLPGVCQSQLSPLPSGWMRVVLSGRVLLLNRSNRILDVLALNVRY